MNQKQSSWVWIGVFTALFGVACLLWAWDKPVVLGWLGLPIWIWYFVLLQIALVIAIGLFVRLYWNKEEE